jgi:hypothetical protein
VGISQPLHVMNGEIRLPHGEEDVVIMVVGGEMVKREIGVHASYHYGDNGYPKLPAAGYVYSGRVMGKYVEGVTGGIESMGDTGNCRADAVLQLGNGEKWEGQVSLSAGRISGAQEYSPEFPEARVELAIRFNGKPTVTPSARV